jgi:hypothetical protein
MRIAYSYWMEDDHDWVGRAGARRLLARPKTARIPVRAIR